MGDSRLERWAPLTGVVYVVLLLLSRFGAVGVPGWLAPADEITDWYTDNSTQVAVRSYLGGVAVFFFLWFVGSLRSFLRPAEGGTGRLSAVAFGGGVAAGALYLVKFTMSLTAAARANEPGGIGEQAATTLYDLGGFLFVLAIPTALAVLLVATAIVGFRTTVLPTWLVWVTAVIAVGLLPTWQVWVTAVIAVGLLSPVWWIEAVLFLAWVLFMSVFLYLRGAKTQAAPTAPTA